MKNLPLSVIILLLLALSAPELAHTSLWQGDYCVQIVRTQADTKALAIRLLPVAREADNPLLLHIVNSPCKK